MTEPMTDEDPPALPEETGEELPEAMSTWYFNGEPLPTWAGYLFQCRLLEPAREWMQKWDERVTWQDLWILWCRLDHACVESEDPQRFKVCIATLLSLLLSRREMCWLELQACAKENGISADRVYADVREAFIRMLELVKRDGVAFWTNGTEEDRLELMEWMECCSLPTSDPRYKVPPHLFHDEWEGTRRMKWLQVELNGDAQSHGGAIANRVHRLLE